MRTSTSTLPYHTRKRRRIAPSEDSGEDDASSEDDEMFDGVEAEEKEDEEDIAEERASDAGDHDGRGDDLESNGLGAETDGAEFLQTPPSMKPRRSSRRVTSARKERLSESMINQRLLTSPAAVRARHRQGVTSGLPSRWRQLEVRCFSFDADHALAHYITMR